MELLDRFKNMLSGFGSASGGPEEDHLDYSNPDNLAAETAVHVNLEAGDEDVPVGVSEVKAPVDYPIPSEDDDGIHFV